MDELVKLLKDLPWATLLAIASGYAGYFVANVGLRAHHKPIDTTFGSLVFGFLASFVYQILYRQLEFNILVASLVAMFSAICLGGFWARWGRTGFYWTLRWLRVSHANEIPTAWQGIFRVTSTNATQLEIKLVDGTWLFCENLADFADLPNGPCDFGDGGDVVMYVTHQRGPKDKAYEPAAFTTVEDWGSKITFIPKEQIARVHLRRKPR